MNQPLAVLLADVPIRTLVYTNDKKATLPFKVRSAKVVLVTREPFCLISFTRKGDGSVVNNQMSRNAEVKPWNCKRFKKWSGELMEKGEVTVVLQVLVVIPKQADQWLTPDFTVRLPSRNPPKDFTEQKWSFDFEHNNTAIFNSEFKL